MLAWHPAAIYGQPPHLLLLEACGESVYLRLPPTEMSADFLWVKFIVHTSF
jgi:hypothetical protein